MNSNVLCTFKFYDENKRRLSIFAKEHDKTLEVIVIPCYGPVLFRKDIARKIYEGLSIAKKLPKYIKVYYIGIKGGDKLKSFSDWCEKMYYRRVLRDVSVKKWVLEGYEVCNPNDVRKKMIIL